MKPLHEKCKQKHHCPPVYPGGLEDIARRIGKRLEKSFAS
ncbi:hypothetical protein SGGMMB4_03418 [Sodalis glossinidius str. 'morsitans']|uniref:Uncharacterized protein n=1 Tax=Sodalis glossinidius (strain morsitans) TaxID=343509 RepID=A0A193QK57_SODGM|nr:hypothetical protein SGGMMB4_03418 [Sodalis glossinidius str. 'morsitans']